ncbi:MAG: tol-pal system protein YbgF [Geminicoccaceae bacterium]|nr:tol-pal system protein YbgF [Geminicoccaceae bacterium]
MPDRMLKPAFLIGLMLLAFAFPPGAWAQGTDASRLAAMQSRILELEEEIRRLTGRVEEVEFENGRLRDRMDRLVGDLDDRLRVMGEAAAVPSVSPVSPVPVYPVDSAGVAAGAGSTIGGPAPEVPAAVGAPAVIVSGEAVGAPPAVAAPPAVTAGGAGDLAGPGQGEQVLGTIPRDALLDLPQPSEEALAAAAASLPAETLSGDETTRFNSAMALLRAGSIDAAEVAFRRFITDFPQSANTPEASFWIGETFLARGENAEAAATFARNVRTYGFDARKAPDNLLKLGVALNALGDQQKACASFDELEKRYSDLGVAIRQVLTRERASAGCG